jgi:hypothetical protein
MFQFVIFGCFLFSFSLSLEGCRRRFFFFDVVVDVVIDVLLKTHFFQVIFKILKRKKKNNSNDWTVVFLLQLYIFHFKIYTIPVRFA